MRTEKKEKKKKVGYMDFAKPIKRISVTDTISSIPIGEERTISLNDISIDSIRSTVQRLNKKGFSFACRTLHREKVVIVKRKL